VLDQSLCKWNKVKLEELLELHKKTMVFEPYSFLYLHDSEKIKFEVAKKWVRHKFNELKNDLPVTPKKKISIGYFSANFKNHPTAYLIREVLDNHNLDQFDVHLFSYCDETNEDLHQEFKNKYKNFYDVSHQSIKEILEFARLKSIDIAIDLDGFTKNNRMEIFASKVAPIQIRYLDFLGTTGADFYQYLIADHRVIPDSSREFYSEKIAYMTDCFFIRDTRIQLSKNIKAKSYYHLPEDHFIFASFNLSNKITEEIFSAWIDILKNTTKTVLWLLIENPLTQKNILDLIKTSKINPERIVFASRVSIQEHLSRHQHVDLFLDTSPYNGHSTSSDALWMNVPIITVKGSSFASRVTSSMLISLGLDFLIANDLEGYINSAIKFAKNIKEVKNIKGRIKEKKITSNLFNMQLYTKNLENIYKKALSNKLNQKKLGHILK
jgi:protein O-GlcNAc transferase